MAFRDASQSQRQPPVLLPVFQLLVRLRLDPGAVAERAGNDLPSILMRFPEIDVRKVGQPVLLIRAVLRESEFVIPMPKIKDEMEMQAFISAIHRFTATIIL